MGVRAKFVVSQVTNYPGGDKQVTMTAVTSGAEENKSFSKYTPSGQLTIHITRETPAVDFFEPGKEYYLDFSEADSA